MSANFVQVSGPGGRVQTFVPGAAAQTYIFNPASLKGTLPGGDFIYADRLRFRVTGFVTRTSGALKPQPNWEQMAQAFGQCRVYSQFLGEMVNKSLNSVPLLMNHDTMFNNGFKPPTRLRPVSSGSSADVLPIEYEIEVKFGRHYLIRATDSCPWLPFLEGGIIELDLAAATALVDFGWTMTGNWSVECNIDWFPDKQALIHAPVQSRLYRVNTGGPEYMLKGVGSPNGLDGVVQGSRLSILSWLGRGASTDNAAGLIIGAHDAGFYAAFAGGGINWAANGINRLDVPFRDQVSIDAVSAWIGSFLADTGPVRYRTNIGMAGLLGGNDLAGWPYTLDPANISGGALVQNALNFWPLVWPGHYDKIADMQKVDGDLSFTATLATPPDGSILHLFRTDEVCGFSAAKVMDLMDRMGLPHQSRGGSYAYVPKYDGGKKADDTTQWGMPLKIVRAA